MSNINIIDPEGFYPLKNIVSADGNGRISLGTEVKTKQFRVFKNDLGQILLDPLVSIPEGELWLWQNQSALKSVQKGLQEASAGELHEMESFAEFAEFDDALEE